MELIGLRMNILIGPFGSSTQAPVVCILTESQSMKNGPAGGRQMDWRFGVSRCKPLYIEWIKQQGPTV